MKTILFISLTFLVGCATESLKVTSKPDQAQVHLLVPGQPPQLLGTTPLTREDNPWGDKEYAIIQISKEGFETESLYIPHSRFAQQVEFYKELSDIKGGLQNQMSPDEIVFEVARSVAEIQNYIKTREPDPAIRQLENLIVKYPRISIFHSLMGNAYYVKKQFDIAISHYRKANELNPNDEDTKRVLLKLESIYSNKPTSP